MKYQNGRILVGIMVIVIIMLTGCNDSTYPPTMAYRAGRSVKWMDIVEGESEQLDGEGAVVCQDLETLKQVGEVWFVEEGTEWTRGRPCQYFFGSWSIEDSKVDGG